MPYIMLPWFDSARTLRRHSVVGVLCPMLCSHGVPNPTMVCGGGVLCPCSPQLQLSSTNEALGHVDSSTIPLFNQQISQLCSFLSNLFVKTEASWISL